MIHIPRFLDLNAATELFQHIFTSVMINNKHAVFLVRPLVPFEHRHWWCGSLRGTHSVRLSALSTPVMNVKPEFTGDSALSNLLFIRETPRELLVSQAKTKKREMII